MHQPLYRQALHDAWELAWHHKLLWVYGLFAAFLGQLGLTELLTKVGLASSTYALYPAWLKAPSLLFDSSVSVLVRLPLEEWTWFFCLLFILFGFFLLLVFVSVSSQGALIRAAAQHAKKKKLPSISDAWASGVKHFWRLFFINLFKKGLLILLAVVVGWGALNAVNLPGNLDVLLFVILFLLCMVAGLVLSFLALYAGGYVVVEEYPLFKSIKSAWELFLSHWLVSIEVSLLVLLLNVMMGIFVLAIFVLLFLPSLLTSYLAFLAGSASWLLGITIITDFVFVLFIILLGSVFTVLITSLWTYLFMKMHHEGVKSRIVHHFTWKSEK